MASAPPEAESLRYHHYRGYVGAGRFRRRGGRRDRGRVRPGQELPPTTVPLRISIVALVMVREKFPLRLTGVVPTAVPPCRRHRPDAHATDKAPGSATAQLLVEYVCIRSLMVLVSTAAGWQTELTQEKVLGYREQMVEELSSREITDVTAERTQRIDQAVPQVLRVRDKLCRCRSGRCERPDRRSGRQLGNRSEDLPTDGRCLDRWNEGPRRRCGPSIRHHGGRDQDVLGDDRSSAGRGIHRGHE